MRKFISTEKYAHDMFLQIVSIHIAFSTSHSVQKFPKNFRRQ